MKYTEEQYLNSGFYGEDREGEIRMRQLKIVTIKKEHPCIGGCNTDIGVGQKAMNETYMLDGKWYSFYTCLPCLDAWIDKTGMYSDT